jgi:hypothetical protein
LAIPARKATQANRVFKDQPAQQGSAGCKVYLACGARKVSLGRLGRKALQVL